MPVQTDQITITNLNSGDKFPVDFTVTGKITTSDLDTVVTDIVIVGTLTYPNHSTQKQTCRPTDGAGNWTLPPFPATTGKKAVTLDVCSQQHGIMADYSGCAPQVTNLNTVDKKLLQAREAGERQADDDEEDLEAAADEGKGHGGGGGDQIIITAPAPGNHVLTPFTAYGTICGSTMNVTGQLAWGANSYTVQPVVQGPNWQINFDRPAVALSATLTVFSTTTSTQETIHIDPQS